MNKEINWRRNSREEEKTVQTKTIKKNPLLYDEIMDGAQRQTQTKRQTTTKKRKKKEVQQGI